MCGGEDRMTLNSMWVIARGYDSERRKGIIVTAIVTDVITLSIYLTHYHMISPLAHADPYLPAYHRFY